MSESGAQRPWHLWAVGIVSLLWNAVGATDYVMTQTRNEAYMSSFTPEQLDYFYGFPAWVVALWAIAVWGGVVGSILLLLGRRAATPVFLVSFVSSILVAIYNFGLSNGLEIMGGVGTILFSLLILVVALVLWLYARAMATRGVLA